VTKKMQKTPHGKLAETTDSKGPSFLVLQGLASPFFNQLATNLAQAGGRVHRVNFCGGDWWFAGQKHQNLSHGRLNVPANKIRDPYLELIRDRAVTDIILFGDCRPLHTPARVIAAEHGLRLWVFEEGYLRPGSITCEKSGTNDFSTVPRDIGLISARATAIRALKSTQEGAELTETTELPNSMPPRVRMEVALHFWSLMLKPLYRHYRSHRPHTLGQELKGWFTRFHRKLGHNKPNKTLISNYEKGNDPFFLVPLQLNSDFQVREHSDYDGVLDFIGETVLSFSRHAPKCCSLMFKSHPLDNGMIDYRNFIAMAAIKYGISGRVDYLDGGDLDKFLAHAEGVVTINSTVGYAALKKSKPIKVMGRALYNMAGLTDQKKLDKFWKRPVAPTPTAVANFMDVIKADTQIAGDFYTDQGVAQAASLAADRILADR